MMKKLPLRGKPGERQTHLKFENEFPKAKCDATNLTVAGERSACVGMVCKWLRSGFIGLEDLCALASPPGVVLDEALQSSWAEICIEAQKCWALRL